MENANSPAMPQNGAFSCADDFNDSSDMGGSGLTKREHFAAMAMQGLLASAWNDHLMAERAVHFADQLLAALENDSE